MPYSVRKNWGGSLGIIVTRPVIILPFIIVAFLEGLALELIYFFPRRPVADIAAPLIRKFFGQGFMHYPANFVILPKLFFYAEVAIYVFLGVFLAGISVNIFKNIKMGVTQKTGVSVKNALRPYLSFLVFGIIVIALMFVLKRAGTFIFFKAVGLAAGELPQILSRLIPFIFTLFLFMSNIILQAFLVLTIPIIVIKKKSLIRALGGSVNLAFHNFSSIFALVFFPFLIYLPVTLLKSDIPKLINRTFPEMTLWIIAVGILLAAFVECFIIVCASQFLLDKEE